MLPKLSYIICTNPRSGSWLLADALTSTRVVGNVREWFEGQEEKKYCAKWNIVQPTLDTSYEEYYHNLLKEGSSQNGIFGMKFMAYQFPGAMKKLATIPALRDKTTDYQKVTAAFPNTRYVWLIRKDKVRQAVSHARAKQTLIWWDIEGVKQTKRSEEVYNEALITESYKANLMRENMWKQYFANNGITPHIVYYEEFENNYEPTVRDVIKFLGVPEYNSCNVEPARLKKQADAMTDEWQARYLEHLQKIGEPPAIW